MLTATLLLVADWLYSYVFTHSAVLVLLAWLCFGGRIKKRLRKAGGL